MHGLVEKPGAWRTGNVGIMQGSRLAHMAPKPIMVPQLMDDLFAYLKSELPNNYLIASCVFHYEIEFIHPFSDGNGRIGRLWQHLILLKHHPIFEYTPIESVIRDRQQEYYDVLGASDRKGESTIFVQFCLKAIRDCLNELMESLKPETQTAESRLDIARRELGQKWFSRKQYIEFFKRISTSTASRDLLHGVSQSILEKRGDKALTRYRYIKRKSEK
jgi:Fic family protein